MGGFRRPGRPKVFSKEHLKCPSRFCLLSSLLLLLALVNVTFWLKFEKKSSEPAFIVVPEAESAKKTVVKTAETVVRIQNPARILFFSRHEGTIGDFRAAMSQFGVNFTVFQIKDLWDYGMNRQTARTHSSLAKDLCEAYDVIFVCDTIVDGRPFMVSLDDCKRTKIVFLVTNRFNWLIKDHSEYEADVRGTLTASNAFWVANNQFEPRYMASKGLVPSEFPMIRPMGQSPIAGRFAPSNLVAFLMAPYNHLVRYDGVPNILRTHAIAFIGLLPEYGGPKTLAKYKAVIIVPYQVSVMKFYENLAAGVLMYLPSPSFMHTLALESLRSSDYLQPATELCQEAFAQCLDYYQPEFVKWFYTFDSWPHLKELLTKPDVDPLKLRANMAAAWQQYLETATIPAWRKLLQRLAVLPTES